MLQYLDKLQKEDMENLIKKREMQRGLMKDVAKANEVCSIPPLSLGQDEDHACKFLLQSWVTGSQTPLVIE